MLCIFLQDPGEFVMNEDESHQDSGKDISAEVEHDSETANVMPGKCIDNSPKAASESRIQTKISDMHNDLMRHSPYGLWPSVMGNVDWGNQRPSHESSVHWSSLLPGSSVAAGKNIPFECLQKIPNCGTSASTICCNSNMERSANPESGLLMKCKDTIDFRPGREHEQFNLWKMASLIRGISPSEKVDKRNGSEVRDEMFHRGSLMDDGKISERLWTFGQTDRHLKMKSMSASSALSYPIFGSETGNSDLDATSESQFDDEKTADGQLTDNRAVVRNSRNGPADDQTTFVASLKTVEQPAEVTHTGVSARMKLNYAQSSRQLSESPENQHQAQTEDIVRRESCLAHADAVRGTVSVVDTNHAVHNTLDKQVSISSVRSLQHEDSTSKGIGASQLATLPAESASSGLTDLSAMYDKSPASSMTVSESTNNGNSLYRRRVKNLLLRQGNSLTEGLEAELPKSPRLQNHFGSAFVHENSSLAVKGPNSDRGNFHKEKCHQEHKGEADSGTDVALCHSPTELSYNSEGVASTGCNSGHPVVQGKVSQSDTLSGISGGVVNFATVDSEPTAKDCPPCVSIVDCSYTGQQSKDDVRCGSVEKGLNVAAGAVCCGTVSHSVCQCCTDSTRHMSPSCHLPIKVSSAAACDLTTKYYMARLGSLPTPTRACAAALCQLSCTGMLSRADSPQSTETSSGCQFSKSASQCTTPCHQAVVKCACVGDGHLAAMHQSSCPCSVKKSSVRGCSARILHQDHMQQLGDTQPHTPCMAHTPYTPCEMYTAREPDTPQESNGGVCQPCTPQSLCSHRTRKYPHTPTAACYFQFPPVHAGQLDCCSSGVCQSPCVSYARCLPSCHTPCMSPLNLTIGQPCIAHNSTPQCCWQHQKLTSCSSRHRHNCVCLSACFFTYHLHAFTRLSLYTCMII